MRLVHRTDDGERTLASDVEVAEGTLAKARGLMCRRSLAEDRALLFPFGTAEARTLHMLFVPFAIDAVWLVDDEVTAVKRLRPWLGLGRGTADTVVELSAGAAADVEPGDRVVVEE